MSVEPPLVRLGKRKVRNWPPDLRKLAVERGMDVDKATGAVLTSRRHAKRIIEERAPAFAAHTLYLDAREVELATPTFFHELLKENPRCQLIGASKDVQVSFDLARERVPWPRPDLEGTGGQ